MGASDLFGSSDGYGPSWMARYPPLAYSTADPRLARDTYVRSWFEKMPYMIDK